MKNKEELIWNYLDGNISEEESKTVEKLLAEDNSFLQLFSEREKLHGELNQAEPEKPSMRFSQNIFEQLPDLYKKFIYQPLIRPIWQRVFLALVSITFLLILGFSLYYSKPNPNNVWDTASANIVEMVNVLPSQLLLITGALGVGFLLLFSLDQVLKRRFREEKE